MVFFSPEHIALLFASNPAVGIGPAGCKKAPRSSEKTYVTGPKPMTQIKNGVLYTHLKLYDRVTNISNHGLTACCLRGFSNRECLFFLNAFNRIRALCSALCSHAFCVT